MQSVVNYNIFLERQVILCIPCEEFRCGSGSRRWNGSARSGCGSAYAFYLPCANTVEPTVLPLACVYIKRYCQLFAHLNIELFDFVRSNTSKHILRGYWPWSSITYSCDFHSLPDLETPPLGWSIAMIFPVNSIVFFLMMRRSYNFLGI